MEILIRGVFRPADDGQAQSMEEIFGGQLTFFSILFNTSNTHLENLERLRCALNLVVLLLERSFADIICAVTWFGSRRNSTHLEIERNKAGICNAPQDPQQLLPVLGMVDIHRCEVVVVFVMSQVCCCRS